jgi:uncharacterized membrane protein YphA (DoxX/SURF4 family)/thiol-disulfide isomerase/thioredoxin
VDTALLLVRLALAVVFATAAVGKLLDLRGSREAMTAFGVPASLAAAAGALLPVAELSVAVALVPASFARWSAAGALVLLLAFIAGISRALAQGRAPDCHCFGQLHSAPAGRGALARNAGLAGLAGFVAIAGPGPSVGGWLSGRPAAEVAVVAVGAALAGLAGVTLRLWRENRRLEGELRTAREGSPLPGLPVGAPAPDFTLSDRRSLRALREAGRPVALVFMEEGCGPCKTLRPELDRWQVSLSETLTISVVEGREISQAYKVRGTPSAVVVAPSGTVASPLAEGAPAIEALIRLNLAR